SAENRLEARYPLPVLTTCTVTKPSPKGVVGGTVTVSWVGRLRVVGMSAPALTAPFAVATKKFTSEPPVKFRPVMTNLPPTSIILGMPVMIGAPGTGVTVSDGVSVSVGVRVGVRVAVCVGVRVGVLVGVRVLVAV